MFPATRSYTYVQHADQVKSPDNTPSWKRNGGFNVYLKLLLYWTPDEGE